MKSSLCEGVREQKELLRTAHDSHPRWVVMWCTVCNTDAFGQTFTDDTAFTACEMTSLHDADMGKARLQPDGYRGARILSTVLDSLIKKHLLVLNGHPCHQTSTHLTFSYSDKLKVWRRMGEWIYRSTFSWPRLSWSLFIMRRCTLHVSTFSRPSSGRVTRETKFLIVLIWIHYYYYSEYTYWRM
jgi:hypothetical protein